MEYLISQLWLCLFLAALLGGIVGWLLRGGCRSKLDALKNDWQRRYTQLEEERDQVARKAQDAKRMKAERDNVLTRLNAMENGANLASSVLKENKDKLQKAEQFADDLEYKLSKTEKDLESIKQNPDFYTEEHDRTVRKLKDADKQIINLQGLLDSHIAESKTVNTKIESDNSGLYAELESKDKKISELKEQLAQLQNSEHKDTSNNGDNLTVVGADNHDDEIKRLNDELVKAREEAKSNQEEAETLQALLAAHEEGSSDLVSQNNTLLTKLSSNENRVMDQINKTRLVERELQIKKNILDTLEQQLRESGDGNYQHVMDVVRKLEDTEKAKSEVEIENSILSSSLKTKSVQLKDAEEALKETKLQLKTVEPQFSRIKSMIQTYEKGSTDIVGKLSELEHELNDYRMKLQHTEERLEVSQKQLRNKEIELNQVVDTQKRGLIAETHIGNDGEVDRDDEPLAFDHMETGAVEVEQPVENAAEPKKQPKESTSSKTDAEHEALGDDIQPDAASEAESNSDANTDDRVSNDDSVESDIETEVDESSAGVLETNARKAINKDQDIEVAPAVLAATGTTGASIPVISSLVNEQDEAKEESTEAYDIEEIEGIGKGFGKQLRAIGIHTTEDLLKKSSKENGKEQIAQELKLKEFVISSWAGMADLLRIQGVDGQFAEILYFSGVKSVEELSFENAVKLMHDLEVTNEREHRVKHLPDMDALVSWIERAKDFR